MMRAAAVLACLIALRGASAEAQSAPVDRTLPAAVSRCAALTAWVMSGIADAEQRRTFETAVEGWVWMLDRLDKLSRGEPLPADPQLRPELAQEMLGDLTQMQTTAAERYASGGDDAFNAFINKENAICRDVIERGRLATAVR